MNMTKFYGSSTKVKKGEAYGYRTMISYRTPGGPTNCPWATDGCKSTCLGTNSGHFQAAKGVARQAQRNRDIRAEAISADGGIWALAKAYVADLVKPRSGWDTLAVRTNGTSDLPILAEAVAIEAMRQGVTAKFYDYTASYKAAIAWGLRKSIVHKTFSLKENNWQQAKTVLAHGVNVAAPVMSKDSAQALADHLGAAGVINGDDHDLRFLDPDQRGKGAGYIIWLTPKGKRILSDTTGFLVREVQ